MVTMDFSGVAGLVTALGSAILAVCTGVALLLPQVRQWRRPGTPATRADEATRHIAEQTARRMLAALRDGRIDEDELTDILEDREAKADD